MVNHKNNLLNLLSLNLFLTFNTILIFTIIIDYVELHKNIDIVHHNLIDYV